MWKVVHLNCRAFKCANNKEGECLLETVTLLTATAGSVIGRLICNEAVDKSEETLPDHGPGITESEFDAFGA